jgi:hypothetical protein
MTSPAITTVRVAVALVQGAALHWLYWLSERYVWPATDVHVFVPLVLVAIFVPPILVAGIGHLRPPALLIWGTAAAILCAGLGFYDRYRVGTDPPAYIASCRARFSSWRSRPGCSSPIC